MIRFKMEMEQQETAVIAGLKYHTIINLNSLLSH